VTKTYDASAIRQLKGLEAVRERPGMYLGDPSSGDALHHCVWEAVDNAVDEHLGGHATSIWVHLNPDGVVSVQDNGRGIPVDMHPTEGVSALQLVMTSLHAGGKFDKDSYEQSAGLHGVGISAVNAVSEWMEVEVYRDGKVWVQKYERGVPVTDVHEFGKAEGAKGTKVTWKRDLTIFSGVVEYDEHILTRRLQELAFLNPGLTITFCDFRGKKEKVVIFKYEGGIKQYVEDLVEKKKPLVPVIYVNAFTKRSGAEIAMTWTDAASEDVRCFANNTFNQDGGTHMTGFRTGITKAITDYCKEHDLLKNLESGLEGSDIRTGLVAVVNIRIPDISFSSQTKDKLVTPGAKKLVEDILADQFDHWMKANPGLAKRIADRAVLNAKAREAAKRAREGVMRKSEMDMLSLPGKLADCQSKDPSECEIYIVEGDSAGGSAKSGRDRRYQAILPLRGKVLNVERASLDKVQDNAEIGTLVTALGCGMEATRNFNLKSLRYHKVIIMTDADVDGSHIRTLLLTLFYRYMPRLIWEGFLYIAVPPLYKVKKGSFERFFVNDEGLDAYFSAEGIARNELQERGYRITRYKGLGEMNPETLWETTMDPDRRTLMQVTVADAIKAERYFELFMGEEVEARREYLEANALTIDMQDLDF
jgi:DNA gyrase subunit B